jgi:hypothetical protein
LVKVEVAKLQKTKFYVLLIISIVLGTLCLSPAISLLTDHVVISSVGQISATKIWAKSGSSEDIQAAVDAVAAAGGGTVYVPEGDFSFVINPNKIAPNNMPAGVIIPGGVSVIGMGIGRTILRMIERPPDTHFMFTVNGINGKSVRISGISFIGWKFTEEGNPDINGICVLGATDFRIHHCYFEDFSGKAILTTSNWVGGVNRGLVDHCIFDNPYHDNPNVTGSGGEEKVWAYGIIVEGNGYESTWYPNINDLLGKYDGVNNILYVEDCTFKRCRHAVSGSSVGGGFYVLRQCNISMPRYGGMVDVHGSWYPSPSVGGRGLEAYNNMFDGTDTGGKTFGSHFAFLMRGGGGAVHDNIIIACRNGAIALAREDVNPICAVKDLWIWNNTLTNTSPLIEDYGGYTENVDYFLYAKPGYTPYPYPHPLTFEAAP